MNEIACRELRDRIDDVALARHDGRADDSRIAAHLVSCADCALLVARQRRLVEMLTSLPAAPRADFGPPRLPAAPRGALLRMRPAAWVASAAAAVLVAVAWHWSAREAERVQVESVVDVAEAPPPLDERLLALTAGPEAVAMRRPTEIR